MEKVLVDNVDVSKCSNYNSKTGKCKIPHFSGIIKFTGLTCSGTECYFKYLQRVLEVVESYTKEQCSHCEESLECLECDAADLRMCMTKIKERYENGK